MVKEGDRLKLGDVVFQVEIVSKMKGPPYLTYAYVMDVDRCYLFMLPVAMWEAAVQGAGYPTDEELKRLKDKYEGLREFGVAFPEPMGLEYIRALEARVRELMFDLEGQSSAEE